MTSLELSSYPSLLSRSEPPWIVLDLLSSDRRKLLPEAQYQPTDSEWIVRKLRCKKMQSRRELMTEFGAVLQFFDGFGENWMALRECLQYLDEWSPARGYVLVLTQPEFLLANSTVKDLETLLKTLNETGQWWSTAITNNGRFDRPAIPFHTIVQCTPESLDSLAGGLKALPRLEV